MNFHGYPQIRKPVRDFLTDGLSMDKFLFVAVNRYEFQSIVQLGIGLPFSSTRNNHGLNAQSLAQHLYGLAFMPHSESEMVGWPF